VQIGQGVDIQDITRVRDGFLDTQYRNENATKGELATATGVLQQLEGIIGEPSSTGLSVATDLFFNSVADMRNNPQSIPARTAFVQQAINLTQTIKQQGQQLANLHTNLVGTTGNPASFKTSQLGIMTDDINTKLASVAQLNQQITTIISSGSKPNDLLDKRNLLLDQLANLSGIQVTALPNEQVQVSLGGQTLVKASKLVDTLKLVTNAGTNADILPALVQTNTGNVDITNAIPSGQLKGLLDMAGNNPTIETSTSLLTKLSTLFETLTTAFNTIQQGGRDLAGAQHPLPDPLGEIFQTAGTYPGTGPKLLYISVNTAFKNDPSKLALAADDATAPANFAGVGDSRNAKAFADVKTTLFASLNNTSLSGYHNSLVARIGTDTKAYQDRSTSQTTLMQQLEARQQSVSGVNLDEESLNLIKYQKAFQASARVVNVLDQVYQSILAMVG
jgi:flagellar hook-associated protein 1